MINSRLAATPFSHIVKSGSNLGYSLGTALITIHLSIYFLLHADLMGNIIVVLLLLFFGGSITSAIFAFASIYRLENRLSAVSVLYSSDLLGGFIASITGALILIPLFGFPLTALYLTAISILMLTLFR